MTKRDALGTRTVLVQGGENSVATRHITGQHQTLSFAKVSNYMYTVFYEQFHFHYILINSLPGFSRTDEYCRFISLSLARKERKAFVDVVNCEVTGLSLNSQAVLPIIYEEPVFSKFFRKSLTGLSKLVKNLSKEPTCEPKNRSEMRTCALESAIQ